MLQTFWKRKPNRMPKMKVTPSSVKKSDQEVLDTLITGIEDSDIKGSEILDCLIESSRDRHMQDFKEATGVLEDRGK